MTFPGKRSTKSLEHGCLYMISDKFMFICWLVYIVEGKNPMMQKQAPEANKKRQHLIYITLTIEFEQQRFLNVLYSRLDM